MAKPQSVAEFERRYEEIYQRMEGIGAGEYLSRAREALARNAGTWRYYGSSRQGEEVSDYSLQERNSVRQLRSRLSAVKPENREAADGLFDFMGQMQETQQRLDVMCSYLEEMQNYIDSQDAPEEHEALYEDVTALMQDMNVKRAEYLSARRYNSLVMDTMLGGGEAEMSQEELDASGPAWDAAKGEFGITDIPWEAKDARAAAAAMAVSRPAGVYMDIQASDPQLAQAFRDGMGDRDRYFTQQMTLAQKGFAVENFDMAFNNYVFSKEEQRTLESQGKDIFDQIFIDGQSLNERYGDKYASLPYYSAAEAMKCEFMADVLQGRQVSVLMAGEEPEIIPLEVQSQLAPIQEAVVNRQRTRNLSFADDIFRSQEELGKRTGQEIWEKRYRMRDKRPLYEDMDSVEPVQAAQISVSASDAGDKFALGENTGSLLAADGDSEEVKRRKERMVSVGRSLFVSLNNQADISMNSSEIYRQMGITESGELFYIDGVPAADYIKTKYPGLKSKTEDMATYSKVLQSEIASAALSGRHRVEAVNVGMDERGAFQVGLVECRMDLENLDGQERFYQTRPSRRSKRLWDDDPDRQARQDRIQAEFTDRLLAGARKELRQREAQRDPFVMDAQRFSLGDKSLNNSFFDEAAMAEIQSHPASETVELRRGDYGGYRSYAQLLLMARHPEIRFADLMDPEKYKEEKLAAGWEVASAFSTLYAGPATPEDQEFAKPVAGIMKEAMGVISRLDIRQEMFYALGQPVPDTKEGVMAVMDDPKNQAVINGVLGGLGLFSVNTFQALNRIHKAVVYVSALDLENPSGHPVHRELAALLTPEEQAAYQKGNHALRSLNAEVMMNRRYRDYLQGNVDGNDLKMVSYGLCAAHMRDLIGEYGRGEAIPQDQILSDGRGAIGGELEERLKEAMARGEVTMAQVLQGSMSRTYREQMIEEAKAAVDMRERQAAGPQAAGTGAPQQEAQTQAAGTGIPGQEAQLQADPPETLGQPGPANRPDPLTRSRFFRPEIESDGFFGELERTSGVRTLHRAPTRASFAMIYGLSVGYSVDDIESMTQEQKFELGDRATEFLRKYPTTGVTEGARKEALAAYGQMYEKAGRQFLKEKFPAVDPTDITSVRQFEARLETLSTIGIDYSQTQPDLSRNHEFIQAFGGDHEKGELDAKVQTAINYLKLPLKAYPQAMPTDLTAMADVAANRFLCEKYAGNYRSVRGRTLEQSALMLEGMDERKLEIEMIMVPQMAIEMEVASAGRTEEYLRGQRPLFDRREMRTVENRLSMEREMAKTRDARREANRAKEMEPERVFDAWYQGQESKMRAEYHGYDREAWERGEIAANMLGGIGKYSASMLTEQRQKEDRFPFISADNQPVAAFLLSTMDRINKEAEREQLRAATLMNMRNELNNDSEEAKRMVPDPEMRRRFLTEIDGRISRAVKPLGIESDEQNMRIFLANVYDQLAGSRSAGGEDGPTRARETFEALPEPVQQSIRRGMEKEIRERAPLALRNLTIEEIMDRRPGPVNHPSSVTMRFEENPDIDANELAAHIARPSKLTDLERGYALATFDQAFAPLASETQRGRLEEAGMDMFDVITMNGQTIRERFGEKYKALPKDKQEEMFKLEVVSASLGTNKRIAFALLEKQPDGTLDFHTPIAIRREGRLHEPAPTFGQRFLQKLGISKAETLQEKMSRANELEESAREDFEKVQERMKDQKEIKAIKKQITRKDLQEHFGRDASPGLLVNESVLKGMMAQQILEERKAQRAREKSERQQGAAQQAPSKGQQEAAPETVGGKKPSPTVGTAEPGRKRMSLDQMIEQNKPANKSANAKPRETRPRSNTAPTVNRTISAGRK